MRCPKCGIRLESLSKKYIQCYDCGVLFETKGEGMTTKCESCRFFFEEHNTCRRYPPQNYAEYTWEMSDKSRVYNSQNAEHAMVKPDGWCGEYQKKEEEKK